MPVLSLVLVGLLTAVLLQQEGSERPCDDVTTSAETDEGGFTTKTD